MFYYLVCFMVVFTTNKDVYIRYGEHVICRYYLRNNTSLEPLVPDDLVPGITREMASSGSVLLMRNVSSLDVAVQLTRRDFEVFRSIEPSEYISDLFELEAADRDGRRQSSRHLDRFSEVTTTTTTATTNTTVLLLLLLLLLPPPPPPPQTTITTTTTTTTA